MSVLDEQAAELKRAWLDEAREGGQADSYAGKRSATRFVWQRQLEVTVPGNGGQTYRATAREISEIGIRFFCRDEIEFVQSCSGLAVRRDSQPYR